MYAFDHDVPAAMLDTALKNPAIFIQITLDLSQTIIPHEKAILTKYANDMTGNSVAIGQSEKGAIMHRKMVIVDRLWRVSGSTNWSTTGQTLQDNELTIIRDAMVYAEARPILDIEHDSALKQMATQPLTVRLPERGTEQVPCSRQAHMIVLQCSEIAVRECLRIDRLLGVHVDALESRTASAQWTIHS